MDEHDPLTARLRGQLDTVTVDAPVSAGLDAVRRRHRQRERRRRAVIGGFGVAVVGVVLAGLAVLWLDDDDRSQGLVTEPGPTATTQLTQPTEPTQTSSPAADGSIVLEPAGPYTDDQRVEFVLNGFAPADSFNDLPRLCATIDGLETCDPLWEGTFGPTALSQMTFTATGWRDCGDAVVDCRIVVLGNDGLTHESDRLQFTGAGGAPDVGLTVAAPDGGDLLTDTAVVRPARLEPDPSWDRWEDDVPADLSAFVLEVCSFEGRLHNQCDILDYGTGIDANDPNGVVEMPVSRDIFGYRGWRDCGTQPCYLLLHATYVVSVDPEDGTSAGQRVVAAAPLRFDPSVPAEPRPTISILDSGPFAPGDVVRVRVEHLPTRSDVSIQVILCNRDPDIVGGCGSSMGGSVAAEGTVSFTIPGSPSPEQCQQDGCFLALKPGQEGAGPLAETPVELVGG